MQKVKEATKKAEGGGGEKLYGAGGLALLSSVEAAPPQTCLGPLPTGCLSVELPI